MTAKAVLRQYIRKIKKTYTETQRSAYADAICRQVLCTPQWQSAQVVLLYYPLPDEVDIRALLHHAQAERKTILLPVVQHNDLLLRVYTGATTTGAYTIEEPTGPLFTSWSEIDLALIPGMAFDAHKHRLGRGKGYYDRTLPHITRAYKMGICFPYQRVENVPTEVHDIPMDEIIS